MGLPLTEHIYDGHGSYPSDCTGAAGTVGPPLPGTDAFARAILAFFPKMKFPWGWGSYCRPIRGSATRLSSHGSGRGVDCYPPVPGDDNGWALANTLADHHLALGVQYIIYDSKQTGGTTTLLRPDPWVKWRRYGNKAAGDHADHLHIELTKVAADQLTFDYVMSVFKGGDLLTPNPTHGAVVAQCAVTNTNQEPGMPWPSLTVTAAGLVVARNGASHQGDAYTSGLDLAAPVVDIISYGPNGYWLVTSDGGVLSFGNAPYPGGHADFYRSFGGKLDSPITSAERILSKSGAGQLVLHAAGDGGVFNVGGR